MGVKDLESNEEIPRERVKSSCDMTRQIHKKFIVIIAGSQKKLRGSDTSSNTRELALAICTRHRTVITPHDVATVWDTVLLSRTYFVSLATRPLPFCHHKRKNMPHNIQTLQCIHNPEISSYHTTHQEHLSVPLHTFLSMKHAHNNKSGKQHKCYNTTEERDSIARYQDSITLSFTYEPLWLSSLHLKFQRQPCSNEGLCTDPLNLRCRAKCHRI